MKETRRVLSLRPRAINRTHITALQRVHHMHRKLLASHDPGKSLATPSLPAVEAV